MTIPPGLSFSAGPELALTFVVSQALVFDGYSFTMHYLPASCLHSLAFYRSGIFDHENAE